MKKDTNYKIKYLIQKRISLINQKILKHNKIHRFQFNLLRFSIILIEIYYGKNIHRNSLIILKHTVLKRVKHLNIKDNFQK